MPFLSHIVHNIEKSEVACAREENLKSENMAKYQKPRMINRKEAVRIFSDGSINDICQALISVAFYESDWRWSQEQMLQKHLSMLKSL